MSKPFHTLKAIDNADWTPNRHDCDPGSDLVSGGSDVSDFALKGTRLDGSLFFLPSLKCLFLREAFSGPENGSDLFVAVLTAACTCLVVMLPHWGYPPYVLPVKRK